MQRPSFLSASDSTSYTKKYRLIALGIIIAAGLVLVVGLGFQGSNTAIGRLVRNVGDKVGFSVGEGSLSNSVAGSATDSPTSQGETGQGAELAGVSSDEILRLINEYRAGRGLQPIVKNDRFCEFANTRAQQISENWSQKLIEENKNYYFRAVCLKCKKLAELIAREVSNPQEVVSNWTDDSANREVLERPGYNIGCVGGYSPDQQKAYIAFELGEKVD